MRYKNLFGHLLFFIIKKPGYYPFIVFLWFAEVYVVVYVAMKYSVYICMRNNLITKILEP